MTDFILSCLLILAMVGLASIPLHRTRSGSATTAPFEPQPLDPPESEAE